MESEFTPLASFELEPSLQDKFWEEKLKREIQNTSSVKDLQMMAILLTRIATQRQGVIRGLVQELWTMKEIKVRPEDLTNPTVLKDESK